MAATTKSKNTSKNVRGRSCKQSRVVALERKFGIFRSGWESDPGLCSVKRAHFPEAPAAPRFWLAKGAPSACLIAHITWSKIRTRATACAFVIMPAFPFYPLHVCCLPHLAGFCFTFFKRVTLAFFVCREWKIAVIKRVWPRNMLRSSASHNDWITGLPDFPLIEWNYGNGGAHVGQQSMQILILGNIFVSHVQSSTKVNRPLDLRKRIPE